MDDTLNELRSTGLKATLPRLKILEIFQSSELRHMTADDVYRSLMDLESDIGLATVYRVLTQFEQAGILTRHHFDSGKAVYELDDGKHHDHLICLDCGRVEEFVCTEIEKRQENVAESFNFTLIEHELKLYGRCQACETKRQKSPRRN